MSYYCLKILILFTKAFIVLSVYFCYKDTHEVSHKCTISSHNQGIGYLSWSPDDKWLLVCGGEDSSEIHLVNPQVNFV